MQGRSPHGERGLKYRAGIPVPYHAGSLPSRGAWIEIIQNAESELDKAVAPLTGSVD